MRVYGASGLGMHGVPFAGKAHRGLPGPSYAPATGWPKVPGVFSLPTASINPRR